MLRSELINLRQHNSYEEYETKFLNLCEQLNTKLNSEDKLIYILQGLRDHTRYELELKNARDLKEAMVVASGLEGLYKTSPSNKRNEKSKENYYKKYNGEQRYKQRVNGRSSNHKSDNNSHNKQVSNNNRNSSKNSEAESHYKKTAITNKVLMRLREMAITTIAMAAIIANTNNITIEDKSELTYLKLKKNS